MLLYTHDSQLKKKKNKLCNFWENIIPVWVFSMLQSQNSQGEHTFRLRPWSIVLCTGWPRKNATLTINNLKKMRTEWKKLCALLRVKFFPSKMTPRSLILMKAWLFFWGNVIFKICPSISKVTIYVPKIFHCVASPGIKIVSSCFVKQSQHE